MRVRGRRGSDRARSRAAHAARTAALTVAALVVGMVAVSSAAQAVGVGVTQQTAVSAVPAAYTPNITNGTVFAVAKVANSVVVGGSFTTVQNAKSTDTLTRNYLLAFDASTGAVSTTFVPVINGVVQALEPGPLPGTVYVGGRFSTVNGVASRSVTLLDVSTGAIVSGFKPASLNGQVFTLALAGPRLLVGGGFTTAGGKPHAGLASLNPTTGALDPFVNVQLTGHHGWDGTSNTAEGAVGPRAMAVNPAKTRVMVLGNFTTADGVSRDQAVLIDLDGGAAAVDPNWATQRFTAKCFNASFDTYVTDVQYSADGSYFVITATGGSGTNADGTRSLCDSASRWESGVTGSNVQPTWIDYTGQDTLWSVAITGTAVYVGGHQRWLNNSNGYDRAGAGAAPRPGLAALDPVSGVPLAWNPGRNPRGAGAYALLATADGLYVGSDTSYIGNRKYKRERIAYFPLAGGSPTASTATASLPSNLYLAGPLPNTTTSNVLYRVDAGGPAVASSDNGPDWVADSSDSDPGAAFRNTGSKVNTFACCAGMSRVPGYVPSALFDTERWDPGTKNDKAEMTWHFSVPAGDAINVNLFFANRYSATSKVGQRVFDIAATGTTTAALNNYDIVADVGDQTAVEKTLKVTAPASGQVTVRFTHEVNNPLVDAIEIVDASKPTSTPTGYNDLKYRAMSGSRIGSLTTVATGIAWSTTRGAFMAGNTIFYGDTDGNFYKASFDGTSVGPAAVVDPYDDPVWDSVVTGSGQTYQGAKPTFYSEMSNVTGAFYNGGRIYYSLFGQPNLYWRWFSPDSGIIGADEFVSQQTGFSDIAGMVVSGATLYYAKRSDRTLHAVAFSNGTIDPATDAVVSGPSVDGNDWRARSLFLYGPPDFPNQLPHAAATSDCTNNPCSFDGSGSFDPDGSITSWDWDFGDGLKGSGVQVTHRYASAGTYTVKLTVTDNRGGTDTWTGSVVAPAAQTPLTPVGESGFNGRTATPFVTVPANVSTGDIELLYVSTNTAGVTTSGPSGDGWQQLTKVTNSTLETTAFWRIAPAGDSATTLTVPLAASASVDMQLMAYTNASSTSPWTVASAVDAGTDTHTAPAVNVAADGSWVLSYWAIRDSGTAAWTLPATVTQRGGGSGTGSGHVDTIVGDSGGAVSPGTYGPQTATSGVSAGRGNMVAVVITPAS